MQGGYDVRYGEILWIVISQAGLHTQVLWAARQIPSQEECLGIFPLHSMIWIQM